MGDLVSICIHEDGSHTPFYSETMPRGGLAAVFSFDVTHLLSGATLTVSIEHRNVDDTTWTTAGTFTTVSSAGVATKDVTDIKELWRWVFTPGGTAGKFIALVFQPTAWRLYS